MEMVFGEDEQSAITMANLMVRNLYLAAIAEGKAVGTWN